MFKGAPLHPRCVGFKVCLNPSRSNFEVDTEPRAFEEVLVFLTRGMNNQCKGTMIPRMTAHLFVQRAACEKACISVIVLVSVNFGIASK
jgi:hypothetical protein